jgi:hypothetical protein
MSNKDIQGGGRIRSGTLATPVWDVWGWSIAENPEGNDHQTLGARLGF